MTTEAVGWVPVELAHEHLRPFVWNGNSLWRGKAIRAELEGAGVLRRVQGMWYVHVERYLEHYDVA